MLKINTYNCSVYISNLLRSYIPPNDKEKIRLGFQVMLINITKFIEVFSVALCLNVFIESFLVLIAFGFLRKTLGGIHAKTSFRCTIFSTLLIVGGAFFSKAISLNFIVIFFICIMNIILTYIYAPADTSKNPIKDKSKRELLRIKSTKKIIIFSLIILVIPNLLAKNLFLFGSTSAVISILPILYKLCKQTNSAC